MIVIRQLNWYTLRYTANELRLLSLNSTLESVVPSLGYSLLWGHTKLFRIAGQLPEIISNHTRGNYNLWKQQHNYYIFF